MSRLQLVGGTSLTENRPLEDAVAEIFRDWDAPGRPGGYVAVLDRERPVLVRAFGAPCVELPGSWSESTRFRIYAVTMTFVAIAMLIAEDRGLLSLSDDVRAHLPELPDYGETVRLHHLLSHSSGIRDNEAVQFLAGFVSTSPCSIEYALEIILRQKRLNFTPGARIQFSNSNYRLLAIILERVMGTSLDDCLRQFIFGPLGMTDSLLAPLNGPALAGTAFGYNQLPDGGFLQTPTQSATTGDGGIISSIRDMVTWLAALRTDRLGVPHLLQRLSHSSTLGNGSLASYGLGVRVGEQSGARFIGHGGEHGGYCCEFLHFLDRPISVVVAANYFDANLEPRIHRVAEALLGAGRFARPAAAPKPAMERAGWYANADLPLVVEVSDAPEGEYGADLFTSASMGGLVDDGKGGLCTLDGYSSVSARFLPQPGRRPMLELDFGDGPLPFEPVSEEYVSPAEMDDYVGLFGTPEINAVHRVYLREGRLFHLRGFGEWPMEQVRELRRVGPDLFVLDYAKGEFTTVRFRRNRRRKIVGMDIANRDIPLIELTRLPDPISDVTNAPATPAGRRQRNPASL